MNKLADRIQDELKKWEKEKTNCRAGTENCCDIELKDGESKDDLITAVASLGFIYEELDHTLFAIGPNQKSLNLYNQGR